MSFLFLSSLLASSDLFFFVRIENENWRPCEESLRLFLAEERAKMKARSERIPTQFTSDPKDVQNIK